MSKKLTKEEKILKKLTDKMNKMFEIKNRRLSKRTKKN
jgi:hypothetical protein